MRWPLWVLLLATGCILAGAALLLAAVYRFDPAAGLAFYPKCRFQEMTGLRCPGCGSTRATHQLLHGNIAEAFRYNCLFVASLPLILLLGVRWSWRLWRKRPPAPEQWRRTTWLAIASVTLILGFWIVRNLPGWPLF